MIITKACFNIRAYLSFGVHRRAFVGAKLDVKFS